MDEFEVDKALKTSDDTVVIYREGMGSSSLETEIQTWVYHRENPPTSAELQATFEEWGGDVQFVMLEYYGFRLEGVQYLFDVAGSITVAMFNSFSVGFGDDETVDGTSLADIIDTNYIDADGTSVNDDGQLILGNEGDDIITGGSGNDLVDAGADNDTINAGAGDDDLIGGSGDDDLYGDAGNDNFIFDLSDTGNGAESGNDVIHDFEIGTDIVTLSVGDISAEISENSDGTVIQFDADNSILLSGVDADVVFATDQTIEDGVAWQYTIPASILGSEYALVATLASGDALPEWLAFNPDTRTFTGTPPAGVSGVISLSVTATNGDTEHSTNFTTNFYLDVVLGNEAPVVSGPVDLGVMSEDAVLVINAADLLSLATDADGDQLTVSDVSVDASIGAVVQTSPTTWTFTPNQDFVGVSVEFTYVVSDGSVQTSSTANIDVQNVNDAPEGSVAVTGTLEVGQVVSADASSISDADGLGAFSYQWEVSTDDGANWTDIDGETSALLTIDTVQADQSIRVRVEYTDQMGTEESLISDANIVSGVPVGQAFNGNSGANTIVGTAGGDTIMARSGHDIIDGGYGDDIINADTGNDTVSGGNGDDEILGRAGEDAIDGGTGNDFINAGRGNDTVSGGRGDDEILGQKGNDTIDGGAGNDLISTGRGNDVISFDFGDGFDTITDFNHGSDMIEFLDDELTFANLSIAQNGADTMITYSDDGNGVPVDQIILSGTDAALIGQDDFIFV